MTAIIEVNNLSKAFPTRRGQRDLRGRGGLRDWLRGQKAEHFEALKDITLHVEPGESLGIIGRNGSGKSTLLSIIAGVTLPTTGEVIVRGRVASLLELGAGFHPMLTGRENVYLNAGLLGMRHAQVDEVFDRIVAFSGIGDHIDQPVDTYSSGMYVRIGFAVAAHTNPDIFLVDEVLSVGDEEFQRQCRRKIAELREEGKTIVFVSHDLGIVNALCERVALLDKGRMVHRETAQKTISFYLRQVGREHGVHTMADEETEAIVCDGRISLFHRQQEVSAPDGFGVNLLSLGRYHYATEAEWDITERGANHCVARGRMHRLPIVHEWTLSLEKNRLRWQVALICERETEIARIDIPVRTPTGYTHWLFGDLSGVFPDIRPADQTWNMVASPMDLVGLSEVDALHMAVLPGQGSKLPIVAARVKALCPHFMPSLFNSEFLTSHRILLTQAQIPEQETVFAPGRHELVTLELDLGLERSQVGQVMRIGRTVRSGRLSGRWERGRLRLSWDEQEITKFLHVYASMLIEQLWNDSHNLQWGPVHRLGERIRIAGDSRRFPFRQEWEVCPASPNGIELTIWMEVAEPFEVQEYHVSVVLGPEYERWETDHESGAFPPFDPALKTWQHANKSYAPGRRARALSSTVPSVTLEVTTDDIPFRFTAINTQAQEGARVLQALCTSESGQLHFDRGRFLYFRGVIRAHPNDGNA
jgi:ABC-type polysaccharide/polyol phosphate transport system ATPase subunit